MTTFAPSFIAHMRHLAARKLATEETVFFASNNIAYERGIRDGITQQARRILEVAEPFAKAYEEKTGQPFQSHPYGQNFAGADMREAALDAGSTAFDHLAHIERVADKALASESQRVVECIGDCTSVGKFVTEAPGESASIIDSIGSVVGGAAEAVGDAIGGVAEVIGSIAD